MKRYGKIVALLLLATGMVWWFAQYYVVTSHYRGHTAEYWILRSVPNFYGINPQAKIAISSLGSNVVPAALTLLHATNFTPTDKFALAVVQQLPVSWRKEARRLHPVVPLAYRKLQAVDALEIIGPEARAAIPELIEVLDDRDPQLAMLAANALGSIGGEAVPRLMERLQTTNEKHGARFMALMALERIGPDARGAIPLLIQTLDDPRIDASRYAAEALGKIGPEAVPPLLERLMATNGNVKGRAMAITAIGNIGAPAVEAVPALAAEMNDAICGSKADLAMERIGPVALPVLLKMFTNQDAFEREKAVNGLSFAAPDEAKVLTLLISATQDAEPAVRRRAAQALGRIAVDNRAAIPPLIAAFNDADVSVRIEAIKGIGHTGTNGAPAVPQLIQSLAETNLSIQEQACLALGRIGAPAREGINAITPLIESHDKSVRLVARVASMALTQTP